MDFSTYQTQALATDPGGPHDLTALVVPLRGLSGEVVSLLSEYKHWLLMGESGCSFTEQVSEEMGEVLWYLSNLASKLNLDLEKIANENLAKRKSGG